MRSVTTRQFRDDFRKLPPVVQELARKAYRLFRENPAHPGLSFKKVEHWNGVYSVRVSLGYRALGKMDGQEIVWFWIGPHGAYDKQI
jgi:hypothetical protein